MTPRSGSWRGTVAAFVLASAAVIQAQPDPVRFIGPGAFSGGSLRQAAIFAFKTEPGRIIMPDWFRTTRTDLHAATADELREKLIDRYSLVWHTEPRILDVWTVRGLPARPPRGYGRVMRVTNGTSLSQVVCEPCHFPSLLAYLSNQFEAPVVDETDVATGMAWFTATWRTGDDNDFAREMNDKSGCRWTREQRMFDVVVIDSAADPAKPPVQAPRFACDAASGVRAAIDALPPMDDWALTFEQRLAPRRALIREHPFDVFVHMAAQDAFRLSPHLFEDWSRALAVYTSMDHSFLGHFLEARLRVRLHRNRSRELIERVLQEAPDFPWAHLALVEWAEVHAPADTKLIERHVSEFTALCPGSFAVLRYLSGVRDRVLLAKILETLTPTLTWAATQEALEVLPLAWRLRLQIADDRTAALALVRDRGIAVARFRPRRLEWAKALIAGYKLVGEDADGRRWIEDVVLRDWPASAPAYAIARERGGDWQGRLPDLPQRTLDRWRTADASLTTSAGELAAAADAYLDAASKYPDLAYDVPPAPIQVAGAYRRRGIRLDRIRPLVEQGIAVIEQQEKYRRASDVAAQFDSAEANVATTYKRAAAVLK